MPTFNNLKLLTKAPVIKDEEEYPVTDVYKVTGEEVEGEEFVIYEIHIQDLVQPVFYLLYCPKDRSISLVSMDIGGDPCLIDIILLLYKAGIVPDEYESDDMAPKWYSDINDVITNLLGDCASVVINDIEGMSGEQRSAGGYSISPLEFLRAKAEDPVSND